MKLIPYELSQNLPNWKTKIFGTRDILWHEVFPSTIHKVVSLDFLEGPLPEGLKNRLRNKPDLPIYPMGYYEIPKGLIIGLGACADSSRNLLYSKSLTFDKVVPQKIKGFKIDVNFEEGSDIVVSDNRIIKEIDDKVINVMMPGMYIYGHWLIDILPKIYMLQKSLNFKNYKIAFPDDLPSYAFKFLRLLGISSDNCIFFDPKKEILRCKSIILPTKCRIKDGSWLAPFIGSMYDIIANRNGSSTSSIENTKLYISRNKLKKQFRKLVNREEVTELILSYGFKEIYPEEYSLQDQIQLFKNADIIIGEFGSALHNSLFGKQNLKVISLQSNHIPLLVQWGICNIKGQSCSLIFGEAVAKRRSINSDFVIDLTLLDKALANYCEIVQ